MATVHIPGGRTRSMHSRLRQGSLAQRSPSQACVRSMKGSATENSEKYTSTYGPVDMEPPHSIKLYHKTDGSGREINVTHDCASLGSSYGCNDQLNACKVEKGTWLLYVDGFTNPTPYMSMVKPSNNPTGALTHGYQNGVLSSIRPFPEGADILLFEHSYFGGRMEAFSAKHAAGASVSDLRDARNFDNVASSAIVLNGEWEMFTERNFKTSKPVTLGPGEYNFLEQNSDTLSSLRHKGGPTAYDHTYRHEYLTEDTPAIKLFSEVEFGGTETSTGEEITNGAKVKSCQVVSGTWIAYSGANYTGTVSVLKRGNHPTQNATSIRPMPQGGDILLFEHAWFQGRMEAFSASEDRLGINDFRKMKPSFNDLASSVIVVNGEWELFRGADYRQGLMQILGPGSYAFVGAFNDQLSSIRHKGGRVAYKEPVPAVAITEVSEGVPEQEAVAVTADTPALSTPVAAVTVPGGRWAIYEQVNYFGKVVFSDSGQTHFSAKEIGLDSISSMRAIPEDAGVLLFDSFWQQGQMVHITDSVSDLSSLGFESGASSVRVLNDQWKMYEDAGFKGDVSSVKQPDGNIVTSETQFGNVQSLQKV